MNYSLDLLLGRWAAWLGKGVIAIATLPTVATVANAQTTPPPLAPTLQLEPLPSDVRPPSLTQPSPNPTAPEQLPPPDQLLPLPSQPPTTPQPPTGDIPETITVERFQVLGSTVFSAAEFAKITERFTNRPISITELFEARSAVTQLYVDRGYITSGAYIPPQSIQSGVVTIQVVEGGLEDIRVTGTNRLQPDYIRSRLGIATQPPLNRDRLIEALQLLQLNPLVENLSAELSAGTSPGKSLLSVRVTEAKAFDLKAVFDNSRSPSVGTDRRRLELTHNNLTGLGDRFTVSYTNTNGSNTVDTSYTVPVSPRDATLSLSFGASKSNVIEEPFDVLDIRSKSRYLELSFRQPLLRKPNQEFGVGVTLTQQRSSASFLDDDLPFPAVGSDSDGVTQVTAARFFQDAVWRSSVEVIALRSQFSVGLNLFNSTINSEPPDSRFFSWRGQAQWVRVLAPETLLFVRGDLQLANQTLLPLEQFGLGGSNSVRGYRQDALLTDNGLFVSAEVRVPIARFPKIKGLLQLAPFVELGSGWNLGDRANPDPQTLISTGIGLQFQLGDRLNARLDWGIPLVSISGEKKTLQEDGIYFSIVTDLF